MQNKIAEVAGQFVDCMRDQDRNPKKEAAVFFRIVAVAGFEPSRVEPGKLVGHYLEQDGSRTGDTYPINAVCFYKVVGQDGRDHLCATGWLNSVVVLAGKVSDREECIAKVRCEIERSAPLDPILLTAEGDMLEEYPPHGNEGFLVDHTRDEDKVNSTAGVHAHCNGWVDRHETTKTHNALVCRKCHLRVSFPKSVTTYGGLRAALVFQRAQKERNIGS